ncbi:hypothetical protein [Candidatus Spongiihabitans sp.]|uniref:hypothetical protein n=1 Tax=Candidatus Spongiihabitans sp. TaxID=3101308 RepID=UPI003C6EFCD8
MTLGSTSPRYRLGLHWRPDSRFDLNLAGERLETETDPQLTSSCSKAQYAFNAHRCLGAEKRNCI